jgi:hypothetical protein
LQNARLVDEHALQLGEEVRRVHADLERVRNERRALLSGVRRIAGSSVSGTM